MIESCRKVLRRDTDIGASTRTTHWARLELYFDERRDCESDG